MFHAAIAECITALHLHTVWWFACGVSQKVSESFPSKTIPLLIRLPTSIAKENGSHWISETVSGNLFLIEQYTPGFHKAPKGLILLKPFTRKTPNVSPFSCSPWYLNMAFILHTLCDLAHNYNGNPPKRCLLSFFSFLFLIDVQLSYNIILVSGVQHSDSIFFIDSTLYKVVIKFLSFLILYTHKV